MSDDTPGTGRLLGAIFAASPDAVVVVDRSGTIVLSSPAVSALFGYFPEELVGEPIGVLIPADRQPRHEQHVARFFEAPHARQMGVGLPLAGQHRDGWSFPVDVSLAPAQVGADTYVAAFVRDGRERERNVDQLHAVNEITRRLLAGARVEEVLSTVAAHARRLADAAAAWVVTPGRSGRLVISAVDGPGTEVLLGTELSGESSRSAEVMASRRSAPIDDFATAGNVPPAATSLGLGPGIYVPLTANERALGALVLARQVGAAPFGEVAVALAEVFAGSTAVAMELGETRAEVGRLELVEEDERIARDLHDTVIQQLFAVGMSLQATRTTASGRTQERIDAAVNQLDDVIRDIRNTIFRLPSRSFEGRGLRNEMLDLAERFRDELGFLPRVVFEGPVEAAVPDGVAEQLLKVVGEALSNAGRHAHARRLDVVVSLEDGCVRMLVSDDGVGIPDAPSAGLGLRNMAERATELGGHFSARRGASGGTVLEWSVPVG